MYEVFEHTADLGVRARAATLEELFAEAARGLFSVIVEDLATIRPLQEHEITLEEEPREDLLLDWLRELLYRFEVRRLLLVEFEVRLDGGLRAIVRGETCDRDRHELAHEVKAITYHDFELRPVEGGWEMQFIVDI